MSKTKPRPKFDIAKQDNEARYYQGMGYHVPAGTDKNELRRLYKLWNTKLQKSGHIELEHFSQAAPGRSSPFFVEPKTRGVNSQDNYVASAYFDYIQTYFNHYMSTQAAQDRYKKNYIAFYLIIQQHLSGVSLTRIVANLKTREFYHAFPDAKMRAGAYTKNKNRSKYWTYISIRKVLNHCWLWHLTDINGELSAKQLEHFNFLGLDVPGTEQTINSLSSTVEPIKLRIPSIALYSNDRCAKL